MKAYRFILPVLAIALVTSCNPKHKCQENVMKLAAFEPDSLELAYAPDFELGQVVEDFTLMTPDSTEIKLSDFAGKLVVLDFWATWCGDCRAEIPAMKELYAEMKGSKFCGVDIEFLGVSFDNDAERWKLFVEENELAWPQGCNFIKWKENPVSTAYGIHWIPTMVIICPEGKIIGYALTTERLREKLEAIRG